MTDQHDSQFRPFLPDITNVRFTSMREQDAHEYASAFRMSRQPPWFHALYVHWQELAKEPYRGVSTDGSIRPGLFKIRDEGVPIEKIVHATVRALSSLDDSQRKIISYHINSPEWRTWSNPEFLLFDKGVRLDELSETAREAIMTVLETTLSPEGYQKAVGAMRVNGFLGNLVNAPGVLNEFSYNMCLFGEPSTTDPWGLSFYGHHLCINIFFYRTQIVISPWFTGAEPNVIDEGPHSDTRILKTEESLGLLLMQSLPPDQQVKAQIYKLLKDPNMPKGRWNHDDQRHLCGASQDNRIVPYEGVNVSSMATAQQDMVLNILREYLLYLPEPSRSIHLEEIRSFFHETYFCWIGPFGAADSFYFRIQSPLVIVEFDHHSGIFLTNKDPRRFHIHTLLRTPNAGDYGYALRNEIPVKRHAFVWEEPGANSIKT